MNNDSLTPTPSPTPGSSNVPNRRDFIRASTLTFGSVLATDLYLGGGVHAAGSDTLKVGLVGCGGRGTGAASQALAADKNVVLHSMADTFEDAMQRSLASLRREAPDKVKVDPERCFTGLDGYKKVLESGVDVVLLATPPGFRPVHFKAAVEANKHIFCEKPMATDGPGVRTVMAAVAEAKRKKLAVVAGFCWRYDYARREFYKRVLDGGIGDVLTLYSTYYTGPVKPMPPATKRLPGMTDIEWQIRNWYNFVWLCGDGLVEQAVHSVDKIAWAMQDVPPLKAVAVGGRQIPAHGGNIYDHFHVNYEYANGVRAFLGCRQQTGCYNQNADYLHGTKGTGTIGVRQSPEILGANAWRYRGEGNNMYQTEHDELFASIRSGNPLNDGDRMCTSTLLAIMGRMAAYTGLEVTWEQALQSNDQLVPDPIDWNMQFNPPPLALPGITKFA